MRHGSARITVDVYSQARNPAKRAAQKRLLKIILPEERREVVIPAFNDESASHLDGKPEVMTTELLAMWKALDQEELFM